MIEPHEYQILINPANLFGSSNEVIEFISLSDSQEELQAFLEACLSEELYEYVELIQTKINELIK